MFTLLIAATLGAYTSQRISVVRDGEIVSMSLDHKRVWNDVIAFFAAIGFICGRAISTGRNTRNYFDNAIVPWLNNFGISIALPSITLPSLPASPTLN
ncbi:MULTISPECIES: hypothetical protein [Leptolyngbya]|uniref:hypothetical protein n=1 Tax=Leptolyngbya TaxID=47251 RepID=UPI001686A367|nr:hypothetical protein [Leptolyngbya sp. FACHB-1624]MBD1859320.1 hypothetical protein [Leptolyngbya sp. FACHB-1624]